jgi:hypothetical protein
MCSTLMKLVSSFACPSLDLIYADILYYSLFKFITISRAHETLFMFIFMTTFFYERQNIHMNNIW